MRLDTFIHDTVQRFTQAGIATARLDCLVLAEDELGIDRARLLAHPEMLLSDSQQQSLMAKVTRREQHVPLAYIRGKAAFYGHIFYITKDVLVPRPESEAIIDILANLSDLPAAVRIADIGTGSGCLGITAALILPDAQVWLYDIDSQALDVARKNTQIHGVDATLTQQDLLTGVTEPFDIILANLPYVPTAYPINSAATFEPAVALFAGDDGLADYRRFWQQIGDAAHKPTHIITEALLAQHPALADIAKGVGYQLIKTNGLIQHYAL